VRSCCEAGAVLPLEQPQSLVACIERVGLCTSLNFSIRHADAACELFSQEGRGKSHMSSKRLAALYGATDQTGTNTPSEVGQCHSRNQV
jgi:hypothetical protein